jgi:hypothetical protein
MSEVFQMEITRQNQRVNYFHMCPGTSLQAGNRVLGDVATYNSITSVWFCVIDFFPQ